MNFKEGRGLRFRKYKRAKKIERNLSVMKKFISLLIAVISVFCLTVCANAADEKINVYLDGFYGTDGQKINFDVPPQTINNRTMVPIRAIFEAMGATVDWDDATQTAKCVKDATTVEMTLNSTTEYINGTPNEMDVSPVVIDGRTLAPARYVAEAFGYHVSWDEMTQTVLISKDEKYSISDIVDGTRKHPYRLGDKVTVNVIDTFETKPSATVDITLKSLVSPDDMPKKVKTSKYYTFDKDTWYLNCDVTLKYYENDSAYGFDGIKYKENFVTSKRTIQKNYTWYKNPSEYTSLELFEGDSDECYIPVETGELTDGETIDYFTITTYTGNGNYSLDQKTIWFSLK